MMPDDNTDTPPHPIDLIHELRGALGLPDVALPDPPAVVWKRALDDVRWYVAETRRLQAEAEANYELGFDAGLDRIASTIKQCRMSDG